MIFPAQFIINGTSVDAVPSCHIVQKSLLKKHEAMKINYKVRKRIEFYFYNYPALKKAIKNGKTDFLAEEVFKPRKYFRARLKKKHVIELADERWFAAVDKMLLVVDSLTADVFHHTYVNKSEPKIICGELHISANIYFMRLRDIIDIVLFNAAFTGIFSAEDYNKLFSYKK